MHEKFICSHIISSYWVHGITIDTNFNIIYFTTRSGKLFRYRNDKIEQLCNGQYDMTGIAWDGSLSLYIADFGGNKILRYCIHSNTFEKISGTGHLGTTDGPLEKAEFASPQTIKRSQKGNLYVVQSNAIREIQLDSNNVITITRSKTNGITDAAIASDGTLYVFGWLESELLQSPFKLKVIVACSGLLLRNERTALVIEGDELKNVDLHSNTISTCHFTKKLEEAQYMAADLEGNIFIGVDDGILKLVDCWKWERFLWIGNLKEDATYCLLARLPRDIIKEIVAFF